MFIRTPLLLWGLQPLWQEISLYNLVMPPAFQQHLNSYVSFHLSQVHANLDDFLICNNKKMKDIQEMLITMDYNMLNIFLNPHSIFKKRESKRESER